MKTSITKPGKVNKETGTKVPGITLGALKKTKTKMSAFKLPLAQGKGEILPALEKDMMESEPNFKNLS